MSIKLLLRLVLLYLIEKIRNWKEKKKSPDYFSKKKKQQGSRSDVVDAHTPGAAPGMRISFLFWNWVHAAGKMRYTCLQSGKGASVRCQ